MKLRRRSMAIMAAVPILLAGFSVPVRAQTPDNGPDAGEIPGIDIRDMHGRSLLDQEIPLVDWEGQVANPVLELHVIADETFSGPFTLLVSADGGRLQFNKPSTVSASGPTKEIDFDGPGTETFYLSIYPDRDGDAEMYTLTFQVDGDVEILTLPITVRDDDLPGDVPPFVVHTDFSEDTTGFFDDPVVREVIELAASDWAYFLDNPPFDAVAADDELSWIYDVDAINGEYVVNDAEYTGFMLYLSGWNHPSLISGGLANYTFDTKRQKVGGTTWQPELARSGGVSVETRGNFNQLGWYISTDDDDWWTHSNANTEITDLYSIMKHEIGHALGFHTNYEVVAEWEQTLSATSPAIVDYFGSAVAMDAATDHFAGAVDPVSLKGAFGWEYGGEMPNFRWQITKLDLLLLEAIGYPLRDTSAFRDVQIDLAAEEFGATGSPSADEFILPLTATDGVPPYLFEVTSGQLPQGLAIDSFTGVISGVPEEFGPVDFTVQVTDSALAGQSMSEAEVSIVLTDPTLDANCDGEVMADDALAVLRALAGFTTGMLPVEPCTGDNDTEEGASIGDVLGIRLYVAGTSQTN